MSSVVDEMRAILDADNSEDLMHIGMPRRSGRYPWGSGDDPYQHGRDFIGRIEELKKNGWKETPENIMEEFGLTTTQYRIERALAKDERRMLDVARAKSLRDDGLTPTQIGEKMGVNESTVRSWFNQKSESRMMEAKNTADFIKKQIDERGMIDVGKGVERELGISKEKLQQALYLLEREGYPVYAGGIPQVTNMGKQTTQLVICPPGTPHKDIYNYDQVHSLSEYTSRDDGQTFSKLQYPKSMDSKRMQICYAEEGGELKDGIVELRRGVNDLSLGNDRYAQVRILVDGTHYIKGMAVYADDLPDGVDIRFNTNKKTGTPMEKVLKEIKKDPDNPFGALIKANGQSTYIDKDGKEQLSLINKTRSEGDWDQWSNGLPSQFLGKQSLSLAKRQLNLAKADKLSEFDDICAINNPTIKKHLLKKFSDECDAAAVDLQAAALPGQKYHVIVPINALKDHEVYAPRYENGTQLALIRYPHGGTFEIPILTVNNKNAVAKKLLGSDAIDVVGITKKNADRLSGADFDGDTVMAIPTHDRSGKVKIISTPELDGLKGFDPKAAYPTRPGMRYMKDPVTGKDSTQMQMGIISNLITDMTLGGAKPEELAAAVRHSMVVIDAGKHKLDYKQSEIDNNISALKKRYQQKVDPDGTIHYGGASTILSRSKGEESVVRRQGSAQINMPGKSWYDPSKPEGALIYKTAKDATYEVTKTNKRTGETTTVTKTRTQPSTRMAETDDAYTLVSAAKHPMELLYADYANSMKALANQARKELANTGKIAYSANAKAIYQKEVEDLNTKLNTALLNAPVEREAQRRANTEVAGKKRAAEESGTKMETKEIKKVSQQALTKYRNEVGAVARRDRSIKITDREWEAIQAGAISESTLIKILNNSDVDSLRERATPRTKTTLSAAKISKAKAMSNSNYSLTDIAQALGVSVSTVSKYLKGAN